VRVTVSDFAEVKSLDRRDLFALAHEEGVTGIDTEGLTDDGLRLQILQKRAGMTLKEKRAKMLAAAPTCEQEGCEAKVVEQEVCAWVSLPKYPEAPMGPTGDPRPAAVLSRCEAGHEVIGNIA
jgi:hypothetical protein